MKKVRSIHLVMVILVLFIMISSGFMTGAFLILLWSWGVLTKATLTPLMLPVISLIVSIILGTMISICVSRKVLKPLKELINATNTIAKGDFSVRVKEINQRTELGELMKSFNLMAEELGSIEIFRNNFINNFSHEFKTPIVSIRGFAKQLKKETLTLEQRHEYTDIIIAESERLTNMSSNILLLTKFENQQIVSDKKEFYLDEQIRRSILLLEKQWSKKKIEFNLDLLEVKCFANEEMISHVWINLLSNAIKFSDNGGEILIRCQTDNENAYVEITDYGMGISQQTMSHIFDKFYQGDTSRLMEGNGLGLSLVKRIIELGEGDITVYSEMGKYTTFQVRLPIYR